jgi:hypothetical protein
MDWISGEPTTSPWGPAVLLMLSRRAVEMLMPHQVWKYREMSGRPTKFEHSQYLGDKRTQVVYDLDDPRTPSDLIDELVASGKGATFGPDSLVEAANRNYKPFKIKN